MQRVRIIERVEVALTSRTQRTQNRLQLVFFLQVSSSSNNKAVLHKKYRKKEFTRCKKMNECQIFSDAHRHVVLCIADGSYDLNNVYRFEVRFQLQHAIRSYFQCISTRFLGTLEIHHSSKQSNLIFSNFRL